MKRLLCDMRTDCAAPVTHVDDKGYAYCTAHGEQRRQHRRCRKLRPHEVRTLEQGRTITY